MGRPLVRTKTVSRDDVIRMTTLFGSIRNAWRMLGLEGQLDYVNDFYRALQHKPVNPIIADTIEAAWARWKHLYLRPEVPASSLYALTHELMDENPHWLPRRKDEINGDDEN